jgi:hypothetical protein
MKLEHLGDALDFWKGGMIGCLQGSLSDIHVLPMFTDRDVPGTWIAARLELYAKLVGVNVRNILRHQTPFSPGTRRTYFTDLKISSDIDLFVDPDTGIQPNGKGCKEHIGLAELGLLLPEGCSRLLLVYQHSSRDKNWCENCIQRVLKCDHMKGSQVFAYVAGNVAMLFVSRNYHRLDVVHGLLREFTSPLLPDMARVTRISPPSKGQM